MDFAGPTRLVRSAAESESEMTELVLPNDTNTLGNLLGGRLMHFIDLVGAMAAYRHGLKFMWSRHRWNTSTSSRRCMSAIC